jgi:hypothetical protein
MDLKDLSQNPELWKALEAFYKTPAFVLIKDAFTSHTPDGETTNETSITIAHGKNLGTRYVFNKIEEIVRSGPPREDRKPRVKGMPDPDMSE